MSRCDDVCPGGDDLANDPLETNNLAYRINRRSKPVQQQFNRLAQRLRAVQARHLWRHSEFRSM